MNQDSRIEAALLATVETATIEPCPPRFSEAIRYTLFPGGGRVRPSLCMAVATALGDPLPKLTDAAAVAIELLHSASLVQDDLPCFDNAPLRRGRMALHQRYDEATTILVGDALIVIAFETVVAHIPSEPKAAAGILTALCAAAGAPAGIAAGQAWESEPNVDVAAYHHAKTAALFEAAAVAGAFSAGAPAEPWRRVGRLLGQAYQIADDVADQLGEAALLGKPIHQDRDKSRPSMTRDQGTGKALVMLDQFVSAAVAAIPDCLGRAQVETFLAEAAMRLCPPHLRLAAKGQTASRSL